MSSKMRLNTNANNPNRRQAFLQRSLNDTISENETKEFKELSTRVKLLEKDLERRQESYITRELNYQKRIEALELEILNHRRDKVAFLDVPISTNNNATSSNGDLSSASPESISKIAQFKSMQDQIIKNVETVQDRAAQVIKEQERDLSRAFQARLFDLQAELEREKNKGDDGSFAWIQRCKRLEIELEWAKEVSLKLEQTNQNLTKECERLRGQFASQEDDRTFLVKQVMAAKKESIRLKAEYAVLEVEVEKLRKECNEPQFNDNNNNSNNNSNNNISNKINQRQNINNNSHHNMNIISNTTALTKLETDEKYKELNTKLRRLLVEERKALQTVRDNYSQELKSRTELELILRQCLDDVRREVIKRATEEEVAALSASMNTLSSSPGDIPRNASSTSRPNSSSSNTRGMNGANDGVNLNTIRPGSRNALDKQRIQAAAQQSLSLMSQSLQQSYSGIGPTLETEADRKRFLQLLLSHEKVVKLLYEKSFPVYSGNNNNNNKYNNNNDEDSNNNHNNHNKTALNHNTTVTTTKTTANNHLNSWTASLDTTAVPIQVIETSHSHHNNDNDNNGNRVKDGVVAVEKADNGYDI